MNNLATALQHESEIVPIRYVGAKDIKIDNVNHTNTVWRKGETVFYPRAHAARLLRFADIWKLGRREDVDAGMVETQTIMAETQAEPQKTVVEETATDDSPHKAAPKSADTQGQRKTLE